MSEDRSGPPLDCVPAEERRYPQPSRKLEVEMQSQETVESQAFLSPTSQQPEYVGSRGVLAVSNPVNDMENSQLLSGSANQLSSVMGTNRQMNSEINSWTGISNQNDVSRRSLPASTIQHDFVMDKKDNTPGRFQSQGNKGVSGNNHADGQVSSFPIKEHWKPVSGTGNDHQTPVLLKDAYVMPKHFSQGENHSVTEL